MNNFNEEQNLVLKSPFPILVIAGPGSGKTKVLIEKISTVVSNTEEIKNIMALTFTNKAADNIIKRLEIKTSLPLNKKEFYIGTFHSIFYKIMLENKEILFKDFKFTKKPKIIEPGDNKHLFHKMIKIWYFENKDLKNKEMEEIFLKNFNVMIDDIYNKIENIINKSPENFNFLLKEIEDYCNNFGSVSEENINHLFKVIKNFFSYKIKENLLSFTDILLYFNSMLNKNKEFRTLVQEKFKYVFIDEYQDTNPIQDKIINSIIKKDNYFIVGDPYQSIYKFLGAEVNNILNKINNENINVIQLRKNYRSNNSIVSLTNEIITDFIEQIPNFKKCTSENKEVINRKIIIKENIQQEEEIIKDIILEAKNKRKYSEIAVISRTNFETFLLERLLLEKNIPFRKIGGKGFYEKKEVKTIISLVKVLSNIYDISDIEKTLLYFDKVGATTVSKLIDEYVKNSTDYRDIFVCIEKNTKNKNVLNAIEKLQNIKVLNLNTLNEIINLPELNLINKLKKDKKTKSSMDEMNKTLKHLFKELNQIFQYDDVKKLEEYISNITFDNNYENEEDKEKNENKINLITAHSAKGLEWEVCYIINAQDEIFPSKRSMAKESELEEEKRLFYVAISRAKEKLFISSYTSLNRFIDKHIYKDFIEYTSNKNEWYGDIKDNTDYYDEDSDSIF